MRILQSEAAAGPSAVALGTFDGVHLGHLSVIEKAGTLAREEGLTSIVYTFCNHPSAVWGKGQKLLSDPEEKKDRIRRTGCDILVMRTFDAAFAAMPAEEFVSLLVRFFQPRHLVVGTNYTFGKNRGGNAALLRDLAPRFGYQLHVQPLVEEDGEAVSSTRIRACLQQGRVEEANRLLGYPYMLQGEIIHGRQIGRTIGFPTINLKVFPDKQLPRFGVYAAWASFRGEIHPCVLNVGIRPTVEGEIPSVEAHILGFSGDLYGEDAAVCLEEFLRPESRFADLDALRRQIGQDRENAENLLKARKIPVF
ncbi:MAG: bifunctional riboflavin kinase/FAD synthetase [Clostridia bacterium]|nr:bifunctional riboflavin kinase/FAD synthetase [Clostridia bacterium]